MFKNCTAKYNQFISGINDSVIITYPDDKKGAINFKENGINYSVPNKESSVGNRHYDEILKQVKEGTLTIKDAD